jgi:DNA polymerase-4
MDAFYASVEQLDNPELKGKPIAVGGSRERGVVAAASYEARQYGVHSAMPSITAARRCPNLIFVKARFERYKEISAQIMEIFKSYTDLVEPLSLDEAYLDVTTNKKNIVSAMRIAMNIRAEIYNKTQLTASAGVSYNKFLAKTASDINKPNGMAVIMPEEGERFIEQLKIEKFHGIGKVTSEKMKKFGVFNGADLKSKSQEWLYSNFGKVGLHYFKIARGIDEREVQANRIRKSIGAENTFSDDLETEKELLNALKPICETVVSRTKKAKNAGKTVILKLKYSDFTVQTRSKTVGSYISTFKDIWAIAVELLRTPELPTHAIRLLGISLSNLEKEEIRYGIQLRFKYDEEEE